MSLLTSIYATGYIQLYITHNRFVVPKSVVDIDLSDNPLILPSTDARHSMFTRMAADSSIHSRTVTSLNVSRLQLIDLPTVVARLKCLAVLDVSHNRLKVYNQAHEPT